MEKCRHFAPKAAGSLACAKQKEARPPPTAPLAPF
jgi:hypothetical protein